MTRYPRDMRGHGQNPPAPRWPNDAKIAVQLVVNYEEGGENNILHADAASEAFLSEIPGAAPWPGQRHANMESIYEYGARAGFWRLHRLLKDLPVTVFGVATALARSPEQVAAMQSAKWEIACHGLKWIDYKDHTPEDERADMSAAIKLHTEVVGQPPRGWYTGRSSAQTVRLVAETARFDYTADGYADDLPYYDDTDGAAQLVVPYSLDCNDMRFATPQGFNSGDQFETYLRDSFDALYTEGVEGAAKMMSVGLHCRLMGRPGRVQALKRFLAYVQSHDGVWFATRAQIADHWRTHHPYIPFARPSRDSKDMFMRKYSAIFEQSPWVAEAAYALELGPAHDSATGLHNAMCRAFRAAPATRRLEVLDAHPDFAGTLTASQRRADQSSKPWTEDEALSLTHLNEDYTAKHGFPFIYCKQDHHDSDLFSEFERRIRNNSEVEFAESCAQVERIALWRLRALLD